MAQQLFHPVHIHPLHMRDVARGLWRLADPKIALASLVPFMAAAALSLAAAPRVRWEIVAMTYLAIFLVEVGKNAVNDLVDFHSGTDLSVRDDERSPFSGGKRVLVDRLLTEHELEIIAWLAISAAALVGGSAALRTDPRLLFLGAAGAGIAVAYSMSPFRLSYRGLGELAVGITYGPGIVLGTMLLLTASIPYEAVVVSFTLGTLIAQVLLVNEMPDERADREAGKRTLVVRLGRRGSTRLMQLLFAIAFTIPFVAAVDAGPFRLGALLAGAPAALAAIVFLEREPEGPPVMAQVMTLVAYVSSGVVYAFVVLAGL